MHAPEWVRDPWRWKPHIFKRRGRWYCFMPGMGRVGDSVTPASAYSTWAVTNGLYIPIPETA